MARKIHPFGLRKFVRSARIAGMSTANAQERIPTFTVGDRLRKAREKTGLDQTEFATEVGISRGTVSSYERAASVDGLKKPYLAAWALRADVPLEWLAAGRVEGDDPDGGGSLSQDTCEYDDRSTSPAGVAA